MEESPLDFLLWDKLWDKRGYGLLLWDKDVSLWDKGQMGMKKYPRYEIRVSEELEAALRVAGAEVVRGVLEKAFLEELVRKSGKLTRRLLPLPQPTTRVPAWKVKLETQVAERDTGESSGLSGSAATPAVAVAAAPSAVRVTIDPADEAGVGKASDKWAAAVAANEAKLSQKKEVAVVRSKVFTQTPEERAERMKMLQGMKLMPQMQKAVDPYEGGDPVPEE